MKSLTMALVLSLATGGPALAAPADPADARFEAMLRVIDVVPDRPALDRGWPDARARLLAAARDERREDWTRMRATSLLSHYADPAVRAALLELASSPRPEVRRTAIYTAARAFGAPGDAELVAAVEARLSDADGRVREHAVRALRWIDHAAAAALLDRLAAGSGRAELVPLARATQARRVARVAPGLRR